MNATETGYTAIGIDEENGSEEFFAALEDAAPMLHARLIRDRHAVIACPLWDEIAALPGFADGPEMAPDALLDFGDEGDQWVHVTGSKHAVFEVME